jgi:phage terminase small subunit
MKKPDYLDKTARAFWDWHAPRLKLRTEEKETFALLCQTYSDWRQCDEPGEKRRQADLVLKLAKEFGLTPLSRKNRPEATGTEDDLASFLEAG